MTSCFKPGHYSMSCFKSKDFTKHRISTDFLGGYFNKQRGWLGSVLFATKGGMKLVRV
jgi:hypothetical protein